MRKLLLIGLFIFLILGFTIFKPSKSIHADGLKLVALTFDDGPSLEYTPRVLEILQENQVPATFFLVGKEIEKHPDIAKELVTKGHQIENHTYSHPRLEYLSQKDILLEMILAEQVYKEILGIERTSFFRPPRKVQTKEVILANQQSGKIMALWQVCAENRKASTPDAMLQRILKWAPNGGVILLHDGSPGVGILKENREHTVKVLPLVIQAYKEKGYKFVTLEEYYQNTIDVKAFPYENRL